MNNNKLIFQGACAISLHAVFQLIQLPEIAAGQFRIEQPIYEQAQQSNGRFMISFFLTQLKRRITPRKTKHINT
jgi:hypothetical protein